VPKDHSYFVYILASKSRRLYIGMTNDLEARVWDHRNRQVPGHTSLYNIDRLIYFEEYSDVDQAIDREKQLKKWRREKKIDLAESLNPTSTPQSLRSK
jgi:putative endonuclease